MTSNHRPPLWGPSLGGSSGSPDNLDSLKQTLIDRGLGAAHLDVAIRLASEAASRGHVAATGLATETTRSVHEELSSAGLLAEEEGEGAVFAALLTVSALVEALGAACTHSLAMLSFSLQNVAGDDLGVETMERVLQGIVGELPRTARMYSARAEAIDEVFGEAPTPDSLSDAALGERRRQLESIVASKLAAFDASAEGGGE